jgi:hypothetical protein
MAVAFRYGEGFWGCDSRRSSVWLCGVLLLGKFIPPYIEIRGGEVRSSIGLTLTFANDVRVEAH